MTLINLSFCFPEAVHFKYIHFFVEFFCEDLNRDISHQPVLKNETPPITPPREEEKRVKIMKRNSSC